MINQDFKQNEDLKKDLQEFELKILSGQSKESDIFDFNGDLGLITVDNDPIMMDMKV